MMKKRKFGAGGMPSMKESMESGNRVSKQVGDETKRMMPPKKRTMPSPGESVKSGNRMSGENAKDLKAVKKYAKGGSVKRYADGGMAGAAVDLEAAARRGENLRELDRMDFSTPKVEAPAKKAAAPTKKAAAPTKKAAKPAMSTAKEDKEIVVTGKRVQKPSAALSAREKQITEERKDSFFKRPLTPAETRAEASKKPVPAPSVTRNYAGRGASNLASRNERVAKNAATEAARPKKPNIFQRLYDMTVNPGVDKKYAKGGSVTRADGCAVKGKTKGKMV